ALDRYATQPDHCVEAVSGVMREALRSTGDRACTGGADLRDAPGACFGPGAVVGAAAGSAVAGAGGSVFMMLTGGIDAADGKKRLPFGARGTGLDRPLAVVATAAAVFEPDGQFS